MGPENSGWADGNGRRCPLFVVFAVACAGCYVSEADDGSIDAGSDATTDDGSLPPPPTWLWLVQPAAGRGYGNGIAEAPDGGVFVAGFVESTVQTTWVTRFAPDGTVVWDRSIPGWTAAIAEHPAGGVILVGRNAGASLTRIDELGLVVWSASIGATRNDMLQAVIPFHDGFVIGGAFGEPLAGTAWIARIDATGNPVWQHEIPGMNEIRSGGFAAARDGGIYVAAGSGTAGGPAGIWLAKLDADGQVEWQRGVGPLGAHNLQPAVAETRDGDVVLAYASGLEVQLMRFGPDATPRWQRAIHGSDKLWSSRAMAGPDDGVIVAGGAERTDVSSMDLWLSGLDATGQLLWQITAPSDSLDVAETLIPTRDGAFLALSGGCCTSWIARMGMDGTIDGSCTTLVPTSATAAPVWPAIEPAARVLHPTSYVPQPVGIVTNANETAIDIRCSGGG